MNRTNRANRNRPNGRLEPNRTNRTNRTNREPPEPEPHELKCASNRLEPKRTECILKYMLKKNMGPMGPRDLGPWALWAQGALGPKSKSSEIRYGNYVVRTSWKIRSNYVVRTNLCCYAPELVFCFFGMLGVKKIKVCMSKK